MEETFNRVVVEFDPVIHRVLACYQIRPYHRDYEDYLQDLRLDLIRMFVKFEGNPLEDQNDRYQFVAYAMRGLRWKFLNYLRKNQRQPCLMGPHCLSDGEEGIVFSDDDQGLEDCLLHQSIQASLSSQDYQIFCLWTQTDLSTLAICQQVGISERTLRNRKQRIRQKLRHLFF